MLEVCCFADVQRMLRMLASVSSVEIGLHGLKMFRFPQYEGHSLFALPLYLKHGGIVLRSVHRAFTRMSHRRLDTRARQTPAI